MHCMASGKRIQCWLLLFVLLCLVGCREAKRKAPRPALLFDSFPEEANEKGTFIPGVVGVAESQSVPLEETELGEQPRLVLGSTQDYPTPGCNKDHDKGHNCCNKDHDKGHNCCNKDHDKGHNC